MSRIIPTIVATGILIAVCGPSSYAQENKKPHHWCSVNKLFAGRGVLINGFSQKLRIGRGKALGDRVDPEGHLYPAAVDVIVVTNLSKSPLFYFAYETPRSVAHVPLDYIEEFQEGHWNITQFCFCGVGSRELELKPGESTEFCCGLANTTTGPQQRRWMMFTNYACMKRKVTKGYAAMTMIEQSPVTL